MTEEVSVTQKAAPLDTLRKYIRHDVDCYVTTDPDAACCCGLDDALRTAPDADLRDDLREFWDNLPDQNEDAAVLFGRIEAALRAPQSTPARRLATQPSGDTQELADELERLLADVTAGDLSTAERHSHDEWVECPACDGSGDLEAADYCNFDGVALGVQFYGIGEHFGAHERLWTWFTKNRQAILSALRTTHSPSEAEVGALVDRWRKASVALGAWMSAALDDPKVCDAMKADINAWFSAGEPFAAALSRPRDPAPSEVEEAAKRIQKADPGYDDMRWDDIPDRRRDAYRRAARAAISATSRPNDKTTDLLREARGRLLALNVPDAEFLAEIDAHLGWQA